MSMRKIDGLSAQPNQRFRMTSDDGEPIRFRLVFRPTSEQWYIDVESGNFAINGLRVVESPDLLYQYRNIVPFGILCRVRGDGEPQVVNDFASERVAIYLVEGDTLAGVRRVFDATT